MSRQPISVDAIITAAVAIADDRGLAAVSMRSIASSLGVEAMSLYHHVANKEAILDGLAEWVFSRLEDDPARVAESAAESAAHAAPTASDEDASKVTVRLDEPEHTGATAPWRSAMVDRAIAMRQTLGAHPWALGLLESRSTPGPALLRHHDGVLGVLRRAGCSVALAAHAYSVIDAYIFGFVLTEVHLPFDQDTSPEAFAEGLALPMDEYPYMAEHLQELIVGKDYRFGDEFLIGLDMILNEIERRLDAERAGV